MLLIYKEIPSSKYKKYIYEGFFLIFFLGEHFYVLGIPKPLAPPPDSRCRRLSRWSPSNQIKNKYDKNRI